MSIIALLTSTRSICFQCIFHSLFSGWYGVLRINTENHSLSHSHQVAGNYGAMDRSKVQVPTKFIVGDGGLAYRSEELHPQGRA